MESRFIMDETFHFDMKVTFLENEPIKLTNSSKTYLHRNYIKIERCGFIARETNTNQKPK